MAFEINKGNYDYLETPERIEAFHRARAFGSGEAYYDYRRRWDEAPENGEYGEYPIHIDLELSTACNLHCPFCYTITDDFKNHVKREFMDFSLFKKVIDEVAGKVPSIRLSLRGEPTLHPDFIKCVHYAKRKGVTEVSTLTNLSKMTPEFFEKVMLAGLDWLTVSFDGLYDEYEKNRNPLKFSESYEKLQKIREIKERYDTLKPVVKIQAVWTSIENNPEAFYNMMSQVCDQVAFNPTYNYSIADDYYEDKAFVCPQLYQRLTIQVTGEVSFCSYDEYSAYPPIGNANSNTIHEIWNGESLKRIRSFHKAGERNNIALCSHCPLTRKTRDDVFTVGGRNIVVKNYENAKQLTGR